MNLVADAMEPYLLASGISFTRNTPDMTAATSIAASNNGDYDAHVSLHSNASAAGQARGAEIYTHRFGGEGERLARDIYQYLSALTPTEDLGVKEGYQTFNGQGMYELRRTVAPAILAEVAFHDNPADAQFIIDNIYELGREISKGILQYFGIPYTPDTPEDSAMLQYQYNGV